MSSFSSLRAKRSNPESGKERVDCFVAERLFRQGRGRHRDCRFQSRAADRSAQRHHLSQPRQCLALEGRQCPRHCLNPKEAYSYQNRGVAKQGLGDLDGALADINHAIRLNPALPSPLINRTVIWRAKGDFDHAIGDATEAIGLAKANAPVATPTPQCSR
jgi:tetratricopeptide (TPR) repeat protein